MIFPDKSSAFYKAAVKFAVEQVDMNCQEVGAHIMAAVDAVYNERAFSLVLAVQWLTPEKMQLYYSSPIPLEAFEHSFESIRDRLAEIALSVEREVEPVGFLYSPIAPEPF